MSDIVDGSRGEEGDLVDRVRRGFGDLAGSWRVTDGTFWCVVTPADRGRGREQGWKLHVSATPATAGRVLDRVVPVVGAYGSAMKFARSVKAVRWLTGRDCDRAAYGKFITIYPIDDDAMVELAEKLHAVTAGLPAPRIPSDRQYRPRSPVHYRFGGFTGHGDLDNDGVYRYLLTAPDGTTVEDRRLAWFSPPPWASDPFGPDDTAPAPAQSSPAEVLLNGRYVVRTALRHSPKGGVYLGEDRATGTDVVIKQARAFAESDPDGRDARDRLRHEARMLAELSDRVSVPRPVEVFEQDEDLFLVEERVHGQPLRMWVRERSAGWPALPLTTAWTMAGKLTTLVESVHAAGFVLRDLSPTNVLVRPDGGLSLIDLEHASRTGTLGPATGTPGYRAPETGEGGAMVTVTVGEDLYSLGGLLFLLATGNDPLLAADDAPARPPVIRLIAWLDLVTASVDAAAGLAPLVAGLLADDPTRRWSADRARDFLYAGPGKANHTSGDSVKLPSAKRLLDDGLAHLRETMTDGARQWPSGPFGSRTDPLNVQHGAAGVLAVILQTLEAAATPAERTPLEGLARRVTSELAARSVPGSRTLPGLYFGRAGTAWALAEAGVALKDPASVDRAVGVALSLPTSWPNPDLTHGLAGAGLAHLRLWQLTGDPRLLERASAAADAVAGQAHDGVHGPLWTIPPGFDSRLAGACHYGFAHGAAGIGYFLLTVGLLADLPSHRKLAADVGSGLCEVARLDDYGAAWWPTGPEDPTELPHWCSGSSGVGTFLLRLHTALGDTRAADLAAAAATAVHRARWQSMPSACHGLAGDGQFLLDMAEAAAGPYRDWAIDLAAMMAARACRRNGRLVVPDETGRTVTADYNVGLAGVVAFVVRLHRGGPRPWMLDAPGAARVGGRQDGSAW